MAGSFIHLSQPDSILMARIEALASLADHLTEPVMVVSPTHALVYANASAKQLIDECPLLGQVQEDGGAFEHRSQPCEACPGKSVLEF